MGSIDQQASLPRCDIYYCVKVYSAGPITMQQLNESMQSSNIYNFTFFLILGQILAKDI